MQITDAEIRDALRAKVARERGGEAGTIIRPEMALSHSSVRIDVAVINHSLTGFEFKGHRESLDGLYGQIPAFSGVFDRVTIVAEAEKLEPIERVIPSWWGLLAVIIGGDNIIRFESVREASLNTDYDDYAIAQLLWRDEVLSILRERNVNVGRGNQKTQLLWSMLCDELSLDELKDRVRETLKVRPGWADASRMVGEPKTSGRTLALV